MLAESTAFQSQEDSLADLQKQYDLVKAQKHKEKTQKGQEAISYMENYNVRQAKIGKAVTDLRAKVIRDIRYSLYSYQQKMREIK